MKKTLLVALMFASLFTANAQTPKGFNFQAVARDAQGEILDNQSVEVRFSLMPGQTANPVWIERQLPTTDKYGVFTVIIGKGTKDGGTATFFTDVDFTGGDYWLKVEIKDGGNFIQIGDVQKFYTVPYSIVSETSIDNNDKDSLNEIQYLSISNDTIFLSNGGFIKLPKDLINDADADTLNEMQVISKLGNTVTLSKGGGSFTDAVDDNDNDTNNEIQSLSRNGNQIVLSKSGGSVLDRVDYNDADSLNEIQTLSKNGNIVSLSRNGGSFIDQVNYDDADSLNELQILNLSNDTLFLSSGNYVILSKYDNSSDLSLLITKHNSDSSFLVQKINQLEVRFEADSSYQNKNIDSLKTDVITLDSFNGFLGEVRMFAISLNGAVTISKLQSMGWAICDGSTPSTQGIANSTITSTPDLQNKFIRMSDDNTSGTTGGAESDGHNHQWTTENSGAVKQYGIQKSSVKETCNNLTWNSTGSTEQLQFNGNNLGGVSSTTFHGSNYTSMDLVETIPPYYELVFFIKVK